MSCWEVDGRLQRVGPGNNAIVCFRGRAVESVWPGVNAVARVPLRGDVTYGWVGEREEGIVRAVVYVAHRARQEGGGHL